MNYTYLNMPVKPETIKDVDYSQSNIGGNPTVNLAIGRLQYVFQDAEIGAANYAINIAHVYNNKLNNKFAGKIAGFGNNWKLNLSQFVIADNYDSSTGRSVLKYMDESGEIHRYVSFDTNKWYNDCKATSTIQKINGEYVLSDGVDNKLYFNSNGYLFKSVSCQNNSIVKAYNYDENSRLTSVYDQRTPNNRINLSYNSNGALDTMVAYVKDSRPVTGFRYAYDTRNNLTAVFKIAYGSNNQAMAEKQILEFCYEDDNLVMIIDTETKAAKLIRYQYGKVNKLSCGFVKENCIASGMTDSANNSLAVSGNLKSGLSCEPDFIEKSFNTFNYMYISASDNIAVEAEVTNECNITLRYYIDRKACITSSFEVDKSFSKKGENLKTLVKYEGQNPPTESNEDLGYINGCDIFSRNKRNINLTLSPSNVVDGKPVTVNYNYSFWLKTKKNYDLLEVTAHFKATNWTIEPLSTNAILVNSQAMGAWQRVVIPFSMNQNSDYSLEVSFWANKSKCNDDFEICCIGLTPSPCAELMFKANAETDVPMRTATQVRLTSVDGTEEYIDIGADFYLTEADIISTHTNKHKNGADVFDLIYCNGTKRRSNIKDMQYSLPVYGFSNCAGSQPFYIHTVSPVNDVYINTHYKYEKDGFTVRNDFAKFIGEKEYYSCTYLKTDYTGKTIFETDEYGTRKDYRYNADGTLKQLKVYNGNDVQSLQKFEYKEGLLVSVDDGLNKRQIQYNEAFQPKKIKDVSYWNYNMPDTERCVTNSIGIFRDSSVCVTEYSGQNNAVSKRLTYENGQIRTVADNLVKYGVQYNFLKDCVTYTQFDGNVEKPIQLDAVSPYYQIDEKYYKTHTGKFYDETGKIIDGSSVEVDAYGKPTRLAKGLSGFYQIEGGTAREIYSYTYQDVQESEFTKKPSVCKNLDGYSATEYKYDNDGNLIGWKETESQNTVFEVKQIAPNATKYSFGDNFREEYLIRADYDINKTAAPHIDSVVFQRDTYTDIDKPQEIYTINYNRTNWGAIDNSVTQTGNKEISKEKYDYLSLHNNILLKKTSYESSKASVGTNSTNYVYDELQYYDNGLVKQETVTRQLKRGLKLFDPILSRRTYQYDNLHRITKEINTGLHVDRTYSYYPDGRLKSISGYSDDVRNFVYDYKGRLTSINGTTTFAYDHFGNRISKTVNGVTTNYKYDVGGRLVSAGNVNYSYNADGIRCKKTAIGSAKGERMYLDGGKILGEDRANYELRYFYDVSGLKIIRLHKNNTYYNYECIKDSQGSIVAIINLRDNVLAAQYEYDALGKCTVLVNDDEMAAINPFRWKGFFYDSETGFYYANGSYYDPETGMYVDAAPVSTVIDNADSPRHIDRHGTLCYNHLAIAGSPYTVYTVTELTFDSTYGKDNFSNCTPPAWLGWAISGLQLVAGIGLLFVPGAQGFGVSMIVGGVIGLASNALGSSIGGGIVSMVNGGGAIGVGSSLLGLGPFGWIAGGMLIAIGAGTMAFGANEIAYGITGTNFIQEWTGMSELMYSGLYLGLNIGSAIGQIAGRAYHLYATRTPIYGRDGSLNRYRYSDLRGRPLYDYDFPHGNINFNHYHGWAGPGLNGRTNGQHWGYWRFLWWLLTRR